MLSAWDHAVNPPRARPGRLAWFALALLVVALHLAALDGLSHALRGLTVQPDPAPIYTRLLKPTPPPAPKPEARPAPRPAPVRPAPKTAPTVVAAAPLAPAPAPPDPVETASSALPTPLPTAASAPSAAASGALGPALSASTTPPAASQPARAAPAPAASAPDPAPTPRWPPSTRLDYTITGYWRGALHGSGALVWTVEGDRYDATLSGSALISFAYRSSGRIDGDWLAPARYTERVFTREKSVTFDRANATLHFSAMPSVLPLPPHAQDSASLFLQLASRLNAHPGDFHPGATLRFAVARPSGMADWTFTIVGMDTVDTALGPLACWHVVRQATQANELGAQIWLSPQLQNLPVQIRLQHSADSYLLFTLDHAAQAAPPTPASAAP